MAKNKGQNRFKIKFNGHRYQNYVVDCLRSQYKASQGILYINLSRITRQRHLALEVSPNHKNCRSCGITKECTCHRRQPNCRLFTLRHLKFDKTDRHDRTQEPHLGHVRQDSGGRLPRKILCNTTIELQENTADVTCFCMSPHHRVQGPKLNKRGI